MGSEFLNSAALLFYPIAGYVQNGRENVHQGIDMSILTSIQSGNDVIDF